jgi:alkylated DNA nucleotide flippase Atl1
MPFILNKPRNAWREQLGKNNHPQVMHVPHNWEHSLGKGTMLVPSENVIADVVKRIPKGKVATMPMIRDALAIKYKTNTTFPLNTGYFLKHIAVQTEKSLKSSKKNIIPYWRVTERDGSLIKGYPGGVEHHKQLLSKEGISTYKPSKKELDRIDHIEHYLVPIDQLVG